MLNKELSFSLSDFILVLVWGFVLLGFVGFFCMIHNLSNEVYNGINKYLLNNINRFFKYCFGYVLAWDGRKQAYLFRWFYLRVTFINYTRLGNRGKKPENLPCSLFIARELPIQTAAVKMNI